LETKVRADGNVEVCDRTNGARLLIAASGINAQPVLESRFSSCDYGAKGPSVSVCWTVRGSVPLTARFVLVPIWTGEDDGARLSGCQNRERDRGPRAGSPRGVVDATGS
jgi:hypothetical protein